MEEDRTVEIRPARSQDGERVRGLIAGIMGSEFSADSRAYPVQDLDDLPGSYGGPRDIFLVAEEGGKIVGTVAIKEESPEKALLRRVFVSGAYRGKGLGSQLLNKAMQFCFDHDYKTVQFRGSERMQAALQLCLRNGFEKQEETELAGIRLMLLRRRVRKDRQ